jgi:signal peptidase II
MTAMQAVGANRYALFGGLAVGGCALDLATKHWVFARLGMPHDQRAIPLVDGVLSITTNLNEGALFGIGQGRGLVFCSLSVVAALGIAYWLFVVGAARDRLLTIALGLVSGGILGNLYDRLGLPGLTWPDDSLHEAGQRVYAVRDWIHFRIEGVVDWPVFNIADTLLVCGAALLIWHALVVDRPRSRASWGEAAAEAPPADRAE